MVIWVWDGTLCMVVCGYYVGAYDVYICLHTRVCANV